MFSSNSTTDNPFPLEVYPSFHVSPPYFLGQNISLHHNSQDLSPGELFPANVPVTEPCSNTGTPDTNCVNANHFETLDPGKKPVRKDRHSKICTAQGTRDRRVRLSIDIAREFFDLQDMLGFDKASRTIDWLLAKSKNAITELVQLKRSSSGDLRSLSSLSELCEIAASVDKEDQTAEFDISAKESRANARARARARTKEKMRIRKIYQSEKVVDLSPNTPEQSSSWNPFEPQLPYIHQAGIIIPESGCVENSNKAALMNDD